MKKAYITPEILTVNLSAQEMMAGSVNIPVNGGDTGSVDYSPEYGGWSDAWNDASDEEEY